MQKYYAHSLTDDAGNPLPTDHWEPLSEHLIRVAQRAEQFANSFNAGSWGRLAGLWHDIGKYSADFQAYLQRENGFEAHLEQQSNRVDHSTAGAQHAAKVIPVWGRLLAYLIAGHHAGLSDASVSPTSLASRLKKLIPPIPAAPADLLNSGIDLNTPPPIQFDKSDSNTVGFQLAFFSRILFSCLVDADFLATEAFMNPLQSEQRIDHGNPFPVMKRLLDCTLDEKSIHSTGKIAECRRNVLAACRAAALQPPGLFSLTVPTGGGKTLSSLAFAIDHAISHGKSRIIYAIPFTSIIEQTANVFRGVFDSLNPPVVLEHHSNVDTDPKVDPDSKYETTRSRLAAENWDAPLVVTTNVQLFESLFAAKTLRCRKLHNIVNSVIILDEAQTLPVEWLRPCLTALNELVKNYHCTIVLCTATQPAIHFADDFPIGLKSVLEIIPEPEKLYQEMRRVRVQQLGKLTDEKLIDRLTEHESFLAIVNTKGHAAKLYRELAERIDDTESLFHLSTHMCGEHRSDVIKIIRQRLKDRQPCRVISTQLIEAGVDVDFPVVYRALSGIDSIAQAAGRCNREGLMVEGTVYVFEPAEVRLIGYLKSVAVSAIEIAPKYSDLLDPAAVREYFSLHYWKQAGDNRWDKTKSQGVMNCFPFDNDLPFDFRIAAERFQMIDETGRTIFVPYNDKARKLIEQLRKQGPSRDLLRRLQRYTITLHEHLYQAMQTDIEELPGQFLTLINESNYDKKIGIRVDRPGYMSPEASII